MAEASDLQHRYIQNTALPYYPNTSVTPNVPTTSQDTLVYLAGSNVMTSLVGQAERRNGFSALCSDSTFTFSGSIQRFFTWRRWTGASVTLSGAYFVMYAISETTSSKVYKQRVGTDVYPALIHTDSTSTTPFDFVVSNNYCFFGNGVDMKKWDGTTVTNWGITGPSAAVSYTSSAGTLSPVIGYQWVICFDSSASTHVSSPSTASTSTGAQTNLQFNIGGNTTTDTQVDRVRIGRTIDGGSIFFEHPNSPISYATWVTSGFTDNSADTALTSNVMPLPNQNNRPPASQGAVWFANRIWTFLNDTLYYSDFEELVRGVEEESFASTNQRFIGREITGLAVAGTFLLIFAADMIFRIYGDSLATFRFDTLAMGKGALNRAAIISFRGLVAWLDSSNCIFATDGQNLPEQDISYPMRSDILSIVHSTAAMAFHSTGNKHWLILMDGGAQKLYVYDLDLKQWMPPWPIDTVTAIYSGQTAAATYKLFLGKNKKPLAQDTNYQDDGSSYTASLTTSLMDIVPSENPSAYGVMDHIEVESGSVVASTVKWLTDEDPSGATYQATATSGNAPPHRTQGTNLVETWYPTIGDPNLKGARRVSIQLNWAAANTRFILYGLAVAYKGIDT